MEFLRVDNTAITDKGLAHLVKLERLEHLDVRETRATKVGVDRLKQSQITLKVLR